ncbi:hypothetical protein ASG11_17110 [Sphingomonas sp. Leaf357]|uniref:hypothetical protein n=1 Tax=Sphingomonas sp. Leaf357 TaxID=1736350 RepID=UPI0006F8138A|nr:hypothetical protein [Sphingomonas sp. Leaf357]KQS01399.1 hypothetical protein ASG11_17110 [Sphingomonas sp. Leaf357]
MKVVRSDWSRALLVCGKCSKKLDGGFGPKGRESLAKALRRHLGLEKGRRAAMGVIEVKCLGICPKRAVTVIDADDPHAWRLVDEGADLDAVVETLGLIRR